MEQIVNIAYEPELQVTVPNVQVSDSSAMGQLYHSWDESCIKVIYNNFYNDGGFIPPHVTTSTAVQVSEPVAILPVLNQVKKSKTEPVPDGVKYKLSVKSRETKKDLFKKARNSGKKYEKIKGRGGIVEEKKVGPECGCPNKCYNKVGNETINKIFKDFWAMGDYNSQNAYLFGLISMSGVKKRYTKNKISRRNFTITYTVKMKGQNIAVCKKAFLNIHGLQKNRGRINNLANKMKEGESVPTPDRRGRHTNRPNAYSEEAIEHCKNHLKLCPKLGRKLNPNKPSMRMEYSCKKCYELYVNIYCKDMNIVPVSLDKYRRVFASEGYRYVQVFKKKKQDSSKLDTESTLKHENSEIF